MLECDDVNLPILRMLEGTFLLDAARIFCLIAFLLNQSIMFTILCSSHQISDLHQYISITQDKRGIQIIFFLFFHKKTYVMGTH